MLKSGARAGAVILACAGLAVAGAASARPARAGTAAAPTVRLTAGFGPERLGRGTTVAFAFAVAGQAGGVPPPLVGLELRYPANLGFALSGLGLATCDPAVLGTAGPAGCPANSRMGFGSALAEIAAEGLVVREPARVGVVRGPTSEGRLALLFYAEGSRPVFAQIVLRGLLVTAPAPFGGAVRIDVPLIPTWPEAPFISVVELRATLGPRHLTYYRHARGGTIAYRPRGILLPKRCPRGGFPFAATFAFLDGSTASAATAVPCPRA